MNWKHILSLTAAAALILGLGSVVLTPRALAQTTTATPTAAPTTTPGTVTNREVTTSGVGQVSIQPDNAVVLVGVQTEAQTASQTLTQNSQQIQKVIDALKKAGVADKDLQTQTVQLNPRMSAPTNNNNPSATQALEGFTAVNIVQVTVRNLTNLGSLLDTAISAGGNTIQYISFTASNPTSVLDQAREAALNDARHKAQQLASLTGSSLGEVLRISEVNNQPRPFPAEAPAAAGGASVPILPGQQTVSIEVEVTWQLNRGSASIPITGATATAASRPVSPTSSATTSPSSTAAVSPTAGVTPTPGTTVIPFGTQTPGATTTP